MSILTDLHHAIVNELTTKIEGIETSGFYPKIREEITAPAVFVDMVSLEPGQDPGTGEVAYIARFEARFMVGTSDEANLQVRELAAEGGRIIYKNSFGLNVKAAELLSVGNDGFNPELDAYEVWIVEWEHELHLGESIWTNDGICPEKIYVGFAPCIGAAYEDEYVLVKEKPEVTEPEDGT